MLNSRWNGDQILVWRSIHIGIAVDTEAGLLVPVIRDVPRLSLRELAARSRDLVDRARTAKLAATEISGSTFTITNLGQLGVEVFTPLINPPECAILGLGRIQNQVVVAEQAVRGTRSHGLEPDFRPPDRRRRPGRAVPADARFA